MPLEQSEPPTRTVGAVLVGVPGDVGALSAPSRLSETESTTTAGAAVSLATVVVAEPVLFPASVTQTLIVLSPSARSAACTVVVRCAGASSYVPLATVVPLEQSEPPTRTE